MAELYPSDTELAALSGTTDSEQEVLFVPTGESPYYVSFYKMLHRLLDVARRAGDLRVYKDGDLTFGVRAGKFMDGAAERNYAGASAQALTNNQTNYIYLTAAGTLTVNITGFPAPGTTPHVPLATILTASGKYAIDDITDYRGRAIFQVLDALAAADKQDLMPNLQITAGAEAADARQITFQARDAANNNLAERVLIRLWVATSDYGAPSAAGNSVAVDTGTTIETVTADAYYLIESDVLGKVQITNTIAGAATRYFLAEIDGRVYSSGAITWAA
jgi:hypothetical protein